MKKLYECMPVGERAWLARVAFIGTLLWVGMIVAVALAPAAEQIESDRLNRTCHHPSVTLRCIAQRRF